MYSKKQPQFDGSSMDPSQGITYDPTFPVNFGWVTDSKDSVPYPASLIDDQPLVCSQQTVVGIVRDILLGDCDFRHLIRQYRRRLHVTVRLSNGFIRLALSSPTSSRKLNPTSAEVNSHHMWFGNKFAPQFNIDPRVFNDGNQGPHMGLTYVDSPAMQTFPALFTASRYVKPHERSMIQAAIAQSTIGDTGFEKQMLSSIAKLVNDPTLYPSMVVACIAESLRTNQLPLVGRIAYSPTQPFPFDGSGFGGFGSGFGPFSGYGSFNGQLKSNVQPEYSNVAPSVNPVYLDRELSRSGALIQDMFMQIGRGNEPDCEVLQKLILQLSQSWQDVPMVVVFEYAQAYDLKTRFSNHVAACGGLPNIERIYTEVLNSIPAEQHVNPPVYEIYEPTMFAVLDNRLLFGFTLKAGKVDDSK